MRVAAEDARCLLEGVERDQPQCDGGEKSDEAAPREFARLRGALSSPHALDRLILDDGDETPLYLALPFNIEVPVANTRGRSARAQATRSCCREAISC